MRQNVPRNVLDVACVVGFNLSVDIRVEVSNGVMKRVNVVLGGIEARTL